MVPNIARSQGSAAMDDEALPKWQRRGTSSELHECAAEVPDLVDRESRSKRDDGTASGGKKPGMDALVQRHRGGGVAVHAAVHPDQFAVANHPGEDLLA